MKSGPARPLRSGPRCPPSGPRPFTPGLVGRSRLRGLLTAGRRPSSLARSAIRKPAGRRRVPSRSPGHRSPGFSARMKPRWFPHPASRSRPANSGCLTAARNEAWAHRPPAPKRCLRLPALCVLITIAGVGRDANFDHGSRHEQLQSPCLKAHHLLLLAASSDRAAGRLQLGKAFERPGVSGRWASIWAAGAWLSSSACTPSRPADPRRRQSDALHNPSRARPRCPVVTGSAPVGISSMTDTSRSAWPTARVRGSALP